MGLGRADIWYDLPPELIAQRPLERRSDSRMMLVRRSTREVVDGCFRDLPRLLSPGDLLVFNRTKVMPARLRGRRRDTGGAAEILLLERLSPGTWLTMLKPSRRCRAGVTIDVGDALSASVIEVRAPGRAVLAFRSQRDPDAELARAGEIPLPPYIRRPPDESDRARYQTVFAAEEGAVAAPTAGLHFDREVLDALALAGIREASLTLHVGPGTFEPLRHDDIDMNSLEPERFSMDPLCAGEVRSASSEGRRIVAVGTTSARVLETLGPEPEAAEGRTSLFIRPPWTFRTIDGLLTNFHLPGSSLLCLVAAMLGLELMHEAYGRAVRERYRFYSYGDAMLIL